MSSLNLPKIRVTSPTLAETMRGCFLRAGLSRATGSSELVLGNPRAWLGIAYHEVLEKFPAVDLAQETFDSAVERLWNAAIARQKNRADAHSLDSRFGSPITWPGYYVARASVALRAQELFGGVASAVVPSPKQVLRPGVGNSIREREFKACGGKLVGRPDIIRDNDVVDYKSGAIWEYDDATQTDAVKAAYVRQLRIYGYLIKESLGWWPLRGILLPLAGAGVEIALAPSDCARDAVEAVELLDAYNRKVQAGATLDEIASPSPERCRWCPYKLLCPPFCVLSASLNDLI